MSKVGLARQAYQGAPKGIRSVWAEAPELLVPKTLWNWDKAKSKTTRKRPILSEARKRLLENL